MNNKHSEKYIRIGLNIALQRKLKKMTQSQLAEKNQTKQSVAWAMLLC